MAIPTIVKTVATLTLKELLAWYAKKRAKDAAQDKFASTPAPVRGCPKCKEIAYSLGQTNCYKCGAVL